MKLSEISEILNGELLGEGEHEISNVAKIENAKSDEITFVANPMYEKFFDSTSAGAIIVSKNFNKTRNGTNLLKVDDPYLSFVKLIDILSPSNETQHEGINYSAVIELSAEISSEGVSIGAGCYIGNDVKIAKNVSILANSTILSGAEIGEDTLIYPNVTVYPKTKIEKKVIIHSGTVIGCDGFGHARNPDGTFQKIPQIGIVVIEDGVEIGSNCTIDRATIGETIIRKGVKLDNQIQVAHNVEIGENTVIAAHTGIAGSTKIGKNCMIGGKVGIVGHIEICDDVIITAATNVSKSILQPGVYSGYRALPQKEELKKEAFIRKLSKEKK